jgi:hypothetical protein
VLLLSSLIVDATQWLYLAEMIFQGSLQDGAETSFWDLCALRIVAPIVPRPQLPSAEEFDINIIFRGLPTSSFGLGASTSFMSIDTADDGERVELQHPCLARSPIHSIPIATAPAAVDQVVRRLGYPGFPAMMDLSVDWGRVEQNDPAGDMLMSLLSDNGTSGGPVLDREGRLIGLLSRSHEYINFSCVQPLRNAFDLMQPHEV